jgi:hypothetical protein
VNARVRTTIALVLLSAPSVAVAADPTPATVAELRACIDWVNMPRLPGATAVRHRFASSTYQAPGSFADAAAFFRTALPPIGWAVDAPAPGVDQKDYLSLGFTKGTLRLGVSGYRPDPAGPMTVTVSLGGNVNVRSFPRPADATLTVEQPAVVMFTTAAKPADAAQACRTGIVGLGWREVPAESAKFFAKEGRVVLRFLRNGIEVGVVAATTPDGKTQVTVHTQVRQTFDPADVRAALAAKDIPAPATLTDALAVLDLRTFPRLPMAAKADRQTRPIARSSSVAYAAPATAEEAVRFHRAEFAARGWVETAADTDLPGRTTLTFEKAGYLVTVGVYQPSGKGTVEVGITNHGNLDPRHLPYPSWAEIPAERGTVVNATTTLTPAAAAAFYRAELAKAGWKEIAVPGRGAFAFAQGASELRLEVGTDAEDRTSLMLTPVLLGAE